MESALRTREWNGRLSAMRQCIPFLLATAFSASASPILAATILFGAPPDPFSGNTFPFNVDITSTIRYQQVYASSFFSGITPIEGISFFANRFSRFENANYQLTLSTSNFAVGLLDTSNLNDNPGANAQLFASVHLSGSIGATFTIMAGAGGGGPFVYDPSHGDLLLDIVRSNAVTGSGSGAMNNLISAGGQFSRAYDLASFGTGGDASGLETEFITPEPAGGTLAGLGLIGMVVRGWRRRSHPKKRSCADDSHCGPN